MRKGLLGGKAYKEESRDILARYESVERDQKISEIDRTVNTKNCFP